MKARVIKEWEMYGITHKVGEIMTIPLHSPGRLPMISDRDAFLLDNGFIEEIKEPLIKDEKARKAIRAWAEANNFSVFRVHNQHFNYVKIRGVKDRYDPNGSNIEFAGTIAGVEKRTYEITELCGEEEE